MSTTLLIIIILAIVVANILVVWFLVRKLTVDKKADGSVTFLQNQINELTRTLDSRLSEGSKEMRHSMKTQISQSQELMKDMTNRLMAVQKGLTESRETSKQVLSITESLQNLEKVLKNQKQRGSLGERGLELILSNVLPPTAYKLQHQFEDGAVVDAVIRAKEGLIPIDAKFSLDNYNRLSQESDEKRRAELEKEFKNDLKKRIDETAKYIRPSEDTLPFALMYIPAEGIYYDLLVNEVGAVKVNTRSLIEYAYRDKKVIIVSPTTLVAYLQTILQGYRAFKIEKEAEKIRDNVEMLMRHLKAYDEYHTKLGKSLSTTVNHYKASRKELQKVDKDVLKITGTQADIETLEIESPGSDE